MNSVCGILQQKEQQLARYKSITSLIRNISATQDCDFETSETSDTSARFDQLKILSNMYLPQSQKNNSKQTKVDFRGTNDALTDSGHQDGIKELSYFRAESKASFPNVSDLSNSDYPFVSRVNRDSQKNTVPFRAHKSLHGSNVSILDQSRESNIDRINKKDLSVNELDGHYIQYSHEEHRENESEVCSLLESSEEDL